MNNWVFLHLHIRQGQHPHSKLLGSLLQQHVHILQQQIEHQEIGRIHHQVVTGRQALTMIHHGDAL